jgi:hypothetical protein
MVKDKYIGKEIVILALNHVLVAKSQDKYPDVARGRILKI